MSGQKVRAGEYEGIYNDMPEIGLGAAGVLRPATKRAKAARDRLGRAGGDHRGASAPHSGDDRSISC
jgi:hypothetical protein